MICLSLAPTIVNVTIETSSNSTIAGDCFNLTCFASVFPNNLISEPVLSWNGPGEHANNVEVLAGMSSVTLSFSPLRTSNGGVYVCSVSLIIQDAGVNLTTARTTAITVQSKCMQYLTMCAIILILISFVSVPQSYLNITGHPRDTNFFVGIDLTLSCNIELNSAIDSPVRVQSDWQKNGTIIELERSGRIALTNATIVSQRFYMSTLRFNPMDDIDADLYLCTVTVSPIDETYVSESSTSVVRNIRDILGKLICMQYLLFIQYD